MKLKKENGLRKFWEFLNQDNWKGTISFVAFFLVIIMYIITPTLGMLTGFSYSESVIKFGVTSSFPFLQITSNSMNFVIVESCSMHHNQPLEEIVDNRIYLNENISPEDTKDWALRRGFTKGDIIFSVAPRNLQVGDVIIFDSRRPEVRHPIIHRIISIDETIKTKGDNNEGLLEYERNLQQDQVMAKSILRIPYLGWIKLAFFDWQKPQDQRGFC